MFLRSYVFEYSTLDIRSFLTIAFEHVFIIHEDESQPKRRKQGTCIPAQKPLNGSIVTVIVLRALERILSRKIVISRISTH